MQTMVQVYTAKTEERARKLNNDICEAFAGIFRGTPPG